jgi:hypothetical protein
MSVKRRTMKVVLRYSETTSGPIIKPGQDLTGYA